MAKKRKFYKKKQAKVGKKELPNNSRIITDKIINDHSIFFLGAVCIVLAIIFVSYDFYNNFKNQENLFVEREKVVDDLNFWNREVMEKPNYRDGYFTLSLLYYQLGDYKNSIESLDKAMNVDPNFEKGKELRDILEEK